MAARSLRQSGRKEAWAQSVGMVPHELDRCPAEPRRHVFHDASIYTSFETVCLMRAADTQQPQERALQELAHSHTHFNER